MLMITVVHAGEKVPPEAVWLKAADASILLTDVDRFVDELYAPGARALGLPMEKMEIHRYALDLNRLPTDVDSTSVRGTRDDPTRAAKFVSGFHWVKTTQGDVLMPEPISQEQHRELVAKFYETFHQRVRDMEDALIAQTGLPRFHIDAHSMPSVATQAHQDSGKERPDIVVSDCGGKSCAPEYKDLVIRAYQEQGFEVSYNWPYLGGRMTETYGNPAKGRHSVQVELKRSLYMDESTREKHSGFEQTASRIRFALDQLTAGISDRELRKRLHGG